MNLGKGKRPFALTRDVAVSTHTAIQQRPEQLIWADDLQPSLGQPRYGLTREGLESLLQFFDQGSSIAEVLAVLMPA
jgi:hypothetical protein